MGHGPQTADAHQHHHHRRQMWMSPRKMSSHLHRHLLALLCLVLQCRFSNDGWAAKRVLAKRALLTTGIYNHAIIRANPQSIPFSRILAPICKTRHRLRRRPHHLRKTRVKTAGWAHIEPSLPSCGPPGDTEDPHSEAFRFRTERVPSASRVPSAQDRC